MVGENALLPFESHDKEDLFYLQEMNYPNFNYILQQRSQDKDYVTFAARHLINLKPDLKAKSRQSRTNGIYEGMLKSLLNNRYNKHALFGSNDLLFENIVLVGPNSQQKHSDFFKRLTLLFSYSQENNDSQILTNLSCITGDITINETDNSFVAG